MSQSHDPRERVLPLTFGIYSTYTLIGNDLINFCCSAYNLLLIRAFLGFHIFSIFIKLSAPLVFCCSSICQNICILCVWTCLVMRGQHAPTQMIIPFRGRSEGSIRCTEEMAFKYVGPFFRCLNHSAENLFLSFILLSLWKPSA